MALNLEKQLQFYGAYHHDPVNVAIHMTCVPAILVTSLLFATNSPAIPLPSYLSIPNLPANFGTIGCLVYATGYILLEPVAGSIIAPFLIGVTAYSNHLTSGPNSAMANYIALGIHLFSWIIQFIGHGVFEGRAPALLDNLFQAVFLAPFFVWMEVLFGFGYRPDLKKRVDRNVERELMKMNAEETTKKGVKANGSANGHAK